METKHDTSRYNNIVVKKMTFSRVLTDGDYKDIRAMLGDKVLEEGTRHIIMAFDDELDYLAFLVATGQATMEQ